MDPNSNPMQIDDSGPDYDPATCITAREIREIGVELPSNIPDCAWVHRWAVHWSFAPVENTVDQLESIYNGCITIPLDVSFDEPFTCYRVSVPVVIRENVKYVVTTDDDAANDG